MEVKEMGLEIAKRGDIVKFNYDGGTNFGGTRTVVVMKSAEDNSGYLLGKVFPFSDSDFRQYSPELVGKMVFLGALRDDTSELISFIEVQDMLVKTISLKTGFSEEIARSMVLQLTTEKLAQCFIDTMTMTQNEQAGDQVKVYKSAVFNDILSAFEVSVYYPPKIVETGDNYALCEGKNGVRFSLDFGCGDLVDTLAISVYGKDGEKVEIFHSPLLYAQRIVELCGG